MISIDRVLKEIYVDGIKIKGADVDSPESEMSLTYAQIPKIKIKDYPLGLISNIDIPLKCNIPLLERLQLYRAENTFHLNMFFLNKMGEWRDGYSLREFYREFYELMGNRYKEYSIRHSDQDGILDISLPFKDEGKDLGNQILDFLNVIGEIIDYVESALRGFKWKKEYEYNELLFTEELVIPLLNKLGFNHVRYNGGTNEFGKDIVFSETDRLSNERHYAAQVKVGNITGEVNSVVDQILGQIEDTFSIEYDGIGVDNKFYISELLIISSGNITENAKVKIAKKMPYHLCGSVRFLGQDDILSLIYKNWPL